MNTSHIKHDPFTFTAIITVIIIHLLKKYELQSKSDQIYKITLLLT